MLIRKPAAIAEPITPATFGPMACISRKLEGLAFWPSLWAGAASAFDYHAFKEEQYDKLADHVRRYVDIPLLYKILSEKR